MSHGHINKKLRAEEKPKNASSSGVSGATLGITPEDIARNQTFLEERKRDARTQPPLKPTPVLIPRSELQGEYLDRYLTLATGVVDEKERNDFASLGTVSVSDKNYFEIGDSKNLANIFFTECQAQNQFFGNSKKNRMVSLVVVEYTHPSKEKITVCYVSISGKERPKWRALEEKIVTKLNKNNEAGIHWSITTDTSKRLERIPFGNFSTVLSKLSEILNESAPPKGYQSDRLCAEKSYALTVAKLFAIHGTNMKVRGVFNFIPANGFDEKAFRDCCLNCQHHRKPILGIFKYAQEVGRINGKGKTLLSPLDETQVWHPTPPASPDEFDEPDESKAWHSEPEYSSRKMKFVLEHIHQSEPGLLKVLDPINFSDEKVISALTNARKENVAVFLPIELDKGHNNQWAAFYIRFDTPEDDEEDQVKPLIYYHDPYFNEGIDEPLAKQFLCEKLKVAYPDLTIDRIHISKIVLEKAEKDRDDSGPFILALYEGMAKGELSMPKNMQVKREEYDQIYRDKGKAKKADEKERSIPPGKEVLVKIGPRDIPGWTLRDVEDKGNCFYDATVIQMRSLNHDFIRGVPPETNPRDSLRLRVQGAEFKDQEWADHHEIIALARTFNFVVAIVDTRYPDNGFVYHYVNALDSADSTPDPARLPVGRQIIKLAYTGNHYLSVIRTRAENRVRADVADPAADSLDRPSSRDRDLTSSPSAATLVGSSRGNPINAGNAAPPASAQVTTAVSAAIGPKKISGR